MLLSPLSSTHEAAGARLTPDRVLLTYGDVPSEYRAGTEGALLLDTTRRGLVRVSGGDAEAFLHRILAGHIKSVPVGGGNRNLLLGAKGKVLFDLALSRTAEGFELGTDPGRAAALVEALDMYLFTDDVTLTDATHEIAPLELVGPQADAIATAALAGALPAEPHAVAALELGGQPVRATRVDVAGRPGLRLDAGPEGAEALWQALVAAGAVPGGLVAYDSLRTEAVCGDWGRDVDDTVYPQEARLHDGFALDKGCYVGQEVVAKIDTYGGLNKRLMLLRVDHDDPVAPGTRLMREDGDEWRDLGVVTSWAYSFEQDGGVVLGYVKRKHQEPGTAFRLGDGPGQATLLR